MSVLEFFKEPILGITYQFNCWCVCSNSIISAFTFVDDFFLLF